MCVRTFVEKLFRSCRVLWQFEDTLLFTSILKRQNTIVSHSKGAYMSDWDVEQMQTLSKVLFLYLDLGIEFLPRFFTTVNSGNYSLGTGSHKFNFYTYENGVTGPPSLLKCPATVALASSPLQKRNLPKLNLFLLV